MQVKSILTVLDKPKHKQNALSKSVELQHAYGADLETIAFRWNPTIDSTGLLDAKERRQVHRRIASDSENWQRELLEEARAQIDRMNTRTVWTRSIADWVVGEAASKGASLVVKTRHPTEQFAYDSTDWQLLRNCSAPLLLVSARKLRPYRRILVALDFGRNDAAHRRINRKVLQAAQSLATRFGSQLHTVYGLEISKPLLDLDIISEKLTKKKILERITPWVDDTLAGFDVAKSRRHFPVGKAGKVVNSKAHQIGCDLLVVGSTPHRFKNLIGLGNTAERIISRARCDVLAVHPA